MLQLTEVCDYEAQIFKHKQMYNRSKNVHITNEPPILVGYCYKSFFFTNILIKMKQITEKEVAKQITELINKNVNQLKHDDEKWKKQYDNVLQELESEIKSTEELIEDFTESKLSVNLIEQEGYLRCLRTMVNRFRDWELYS